MEARVQGFSMAFRGLGFRDTRPQRNLGIQRVPCLASTQTLKQRKKCLLRVLAIAFAVQGLWGVG